MSVFIATCKLAVVFLKKEGGNSKNTITQTAHCEVETLLHFLSVEVFLQGLIQISLNQKKYHESPGFNGFIQALEIRIRPWHFFFFFFFSLQLGFQKSSSYFCSLQSKSGGRVLPEEQCIFLRTLYRIPILCIRIDVETVLINIFNLHFNCLPGCEMTCLGKGAFFLVPVVCTVPARQQGWKHPGHWLFC